MFRRWKNRSTRRKNSRCRVESQQTQPTYDAESGNRTRATLVGGFTLITSPSLHPKSWNYIILSDSPFKEETSESHSRPCFVIFELNLLPSLKKVKDLKTAHDIAK